MATELELRCVAGLAEGRAEMFLRVAGRARSEYEADPSLIDTDFARTVLCALSAADLYGAPINIEAAVAAGRALYERDLKLLRENRGASISAQEDE